MLLNRCVNKSRNGGSIMKKILGGFAIALISLSAMAEHHGAENEGLHAAIQAFDHAYATNDVETYFGFYADDATRAFETDVWQKIDGKWKLISLHYSDIAPDE